MLGPAFTLLVTSTAAARMDAEANDWSETAQTSKLGWDINGTDGTWGTGDE